MQLTQIPTDIKCSSKEQYDLNSQICEEVGITGADVFKIIVKGGEHMTDNPGKVQVWASGNDVTKVRILSQSSLSAPAGISFEFQPDIVKINDSFTVCYRPLANLAPKERQSLCVLMDLTLRRRNLKLSHSNPGDQTLVEHTEYDQSLYG